MYKIIKRPVLMYESERWATMEMSERNLLILRGIYKIPMLDMIRSR